jgi:hypothetical protein
MSSNRSDSAPTGEFNDNDYANRTGDDGAVPVVKDGAVDEPYADGNADSDQQLERDDKDAIDESNIVDSRTRGATKKAGTYAEPGDDEVCVS